MDQTQNIEHTYIYIYIYTNPEAYLSACEASVKANESKHLIKPMLAAVRQFHDGSRHFDHLLRAYECADEMNRIVTQDEGLFLDTYSSQKLAHLGEEIILHYNALTISSLDSGVLRFNPIFKCHFLLHITALSKWQHPRATWCYVFEDFVGRIKKLAVSGYHGCALHRIPQKVLEQYCLALAIMLKSALHGQP